jgi:preprotein translocase subunit YajC
MNLTGIVLGQASSGGGGELFWAYLFPMLMIFMIMYFIWLRPQRKKEDERKRMLDMLKKNDRVVTVGGIYGVVVTTKEDEVVLKVDEEKNVKMRFTRSAISKVVSDGQATQAE